MAASLQLTNVLREFRETHPIQILQWGPHRWEYVCGGNQGISILLAGGGGSTAESMFSINAALEPFCRVVSVCIPTTASTVADITLGIRAILDALGIERTVLVGHSLGGLVVQSFAVYYPQRVSGLVLSNTGFYLGLRAVLLPAVAGLMAEIPEALLLRMVTSQMARLLQSAEQPEFWLDFYRKELNQPGAGARIRHQMMLMAKFARFFRQNPIRSSLPWVQAVPVQIISSEDDRGFTKREVAFLGQLYPKSQTLMLPKGSGHLTFLTRPQEYVRSLREFLT